MPGILLAVLALRNVVDLVKGLSHQLMLFFHRYVFTNNLYIFLDVDILQMIDKLLTGSQKVASLDFWQVGLN